jgi:hypothetical protein
MGTYCGKRLSASDTSALSPFSLVADDPRLRMSI